MIPIAQPLISMIFACFSQNLQRNSYFVPRLGFFLTGPRCARVEKGRPRHEASFSSRSWKNTFFCAAGRYGKAFFAPTVRGVGRKRLFRSVFALFTVLGPCRWCQCPCRWCHCPCRWCQCLSLTQPDTGKCFWHPRPED